MAKRGKKYDVDNEVWTPDNEAVEIIKEIQFGKLHTDPESFDAEKILVLLQALDPGTSLPWRISLFLAERKKLDLRDTGVTMIPDSISLLVSLKELYLNDKIIALPDELGNLSSLEVLDLRGSLVESLPESIGNLQLLKRLDLRDVPVSTLPKSIGNLLSLKELLLSGTDICCLPDEIGHLRSLEYLDVSDTAIDSLPGTIGELTSLQELYANQSNISKIPDAICGLPSLQLLDLSETPLLVLPDLIGQLENLQKITIARTQISHLPESFWQLSGIEEIDIHETPLAELPERLGELRSLRVLMANKSQISRVPDSIGTLYELEDLFLSETKIEHLPDSLCQLQKLVTLTLNGTKISALPERIGQLKSLRILDLANMTLDRIPESLAKSGLAFITSGYNVHEIYAKGINLYNTTLREQNISVFLDTPDLIHSLYDDQVVVRECKVIFLGDGEAGKSYTIKRILNNCHKEDEKCKYLTAETPGVEIVDYTVKRAEDSFDIHFWDFGGQQLLHSMHRCFLTDETCYVVTVKTRETNANERARFWLRNVTAFAPNSPIILFVNCWENDDGKRSIDETRLQIEFPCIQSIVYCSAKRSEDWEFKYNVLFPIINMAVKSGGCARTVNRRWANVRAAIVHENRHYLDQERYHSLCWENGIVDEQAPELLTFFNNLGVCFSYHIDRKSKKELAEYKLLNPLWLTNAIYAIIEEGMAVAKEGIITTSAIHQMLGNYALSFIRGKPYKRTMPDFIYSIDECQYVIDVAIAFNLCYRVDENTLFFPALCKDNTPQDALKNQIDYPNVVEYELKYQYLPDSVVHQLMIGCLRSDLAINCCWLKGMVFGGMDSFKTIVRMRDDETLSIRFFSKAEHSIYNLFLLIRKQIKEINDALNLQAAEFIVDGNDRYSLISLLGAAQDDNYVYGPTSGERHSAKSLLGKFYDDWTIKNMKVEKGHILVPILPVEFHHYRQDDDLLREALYEAYHHTCYYCGKPIDTIWNMQVDHILPKKYKDLPELSEYVRYLEERGFCIEKPDYIENYLPIHAKCNLNKSNTVEPFALIARHETAAKNAQRVLGLIQKKKDKN